MAGYIGQRSVTLSTTVANAQDVTATDTTPEVTIINNTHEDSDSGREGKVIFKGQQSGGEESTLAEIEANHHGSADDEKGQLIFRTNDGSDGASPTEAMRIASDQKVGIGTSSPSHSLHLSSSSGSTLAITAGTSDNAQVRFGDSSDDDAGKINYDNSSNHMAFHTNASERMRIDSSGNLIVAKTALGSDAGAELRSTGYVSFTRDNATVFTVRRNGTESAHMNFIHDTGEIGAIGTSGAALRMFSTATNYKGLAFEFKAITPTSNQGVDQDNSTDLGSATTRFDDVRATNGTIQTSDENDKQDIASLTSAEITAATAISKLFKTYKWKDKVADKGDSARTHTGVVAQQVQTAMADAGLDASKYAFWCSDTWWEKDVEVAAVEANEEEGREAADAYTRTDTYSTKDAAPEGATERTRLGVRYPELLAFIGAATEQRLTSIEARLTALEAA